MKTIERKVLTGKKVTFTLDHNPYNVSIFLPKGKEHKKEIIMPIFNYQGERQYLDLITAFLDANYKVVVVNLLSIGDHVLFFNYYFTIFKDLLAKLSHRNYIQRSNNILVAFGVAANLASYMNFVKDDNFDFEKIILISPLNNYKGEYRISNDVDKFSIPTYIYYGQFDSITDINTRYLIFKNGKDNMNVHFTAYPATGHYLYYEGVTSLDLEKRYRDSEVDVVLGETNKPNIALLPEVAKMNEDFFRHVFNVIENKPNPERVGLLMDVCHYFTSGVSRVVNNLKEELDKLGYETYVVALWEKKVDFTSLPSSHHIPILAHKTWFKKGHQDLKLLESFSVTTNAKMLAMFDFKYIHLHTEYTIGLTGLKLAGMLDTKVVYSYYTLWKNSYQNKNTRFATDFGLKLSKTPTINKVFKESDVIIVPSNKSRDWLKEEMSDKDVRVIPNGIDLKKFTLSKEDEKEVKILKEKYGLKNKKVLGYVGRISITKNLDETLNYIAGIKKEIPNIKFMIVGSGEASESLRTLAKKLDIEDNVIFVGEVEYTKLKLYYALFDVFVTAANFETQSLAYFEAAATNTLLLAKKDRALENIFFDGYNCLIYENEKEWQEKLKKALFDDNEKLVKEAKAMVKEHSSTIWGKQIEEIYHKFN